MEEDFFFFLEEELQKKLYMTLPHIGAPKNEDVWWLNHELTWVLSVKLAYYCMTRMATIGVFFFLSLWRLWRECGSLVPP